MARCLLASGRCGRLGKPCASGRCLARTVRRLHHRRWRDKLGLFVAEGEDLVEAAAAAGVEPVELLMAGKTVEPELLGQVSSLAHPPRVIGIYRRADLPVGAVAETGLALWRVGDPGNVGALLRAADALGPAFVAFSDGCADPTAPKALRASAGAIFRVPTCVFWSLRGRGSRWCRAVAFRSRSAASRVARRSSWGLRGRDYPPRCSSSATSV